MGLSKGEVMLTREDREAIREIVREVVGEELDKRIITYVDDEQMGMLRPLLEKKTPKPLRRPNRNRPIKEPS